jgi:pimeloyl-ACP methyl ester carboxylesterase
MQHRRWAVGFATGTGLLGLTVTSSLAVLAHYFVDEFSRPHTLLAEELFIWTIAEVPGEPSLSLQRSLLFETSDGTLLSGEFWAQPAIAPTIVLCHGYRISRSHLRSVAAMEYARGYNILLFDFRGHGASDSVMTSGGNAEVRDLEAALEIARRQPETLPGKMIIHGFSMGAAVALLTPLHADVIAIIADSPYARSDDVVQRVVYYSLMNELRRRLPHSHQLHHFVPFVAWIIVLMCLLDFRLRFGFGFLARPDASFRRWQEQAKTALSLRAIPILLMHAIGDQVIPIEHARSIAASAKLYDVPLETYFADSVDHCGAYMYDPVQYNTVIKDFLARCLKDDFPTLHRQVD